MKRASPLRHIVRPLLVVVLAASVLGALAADSLRTAEDEELGRFLVDGDGMSVYLFLPDEPNTSTCTGGCAEAWPPVAGPEGDMASLELGPEVDAGLVGSIERDDGGSQVTYNGWPLYYFARDAAAGDIAGQGAGGNWYLVSPAGEPVGAETAPTEDAGSGGDAEAGEQEEGEGASGAQSDGEMFAAFMSQGEQVYSAHCASCHGDQGDEAIGSHTVSIVDEGDETVANAGRFSRRVLFGGGYMPAFGDRLTDQEVAAVVTYVRNSWGFDHPMVTEEEVVEQREQFQ